MPLVCWSSRLAFLLSMTAALMTTVQSAAWAQQQINVIPPNATFQSRDGFIGIEVGRSTGPYWQGTAQEYNCFVLVQVFPGRAADRAGLKPGNELCSVNGAHFRTSASLISYLRGLAPGSPVRLGYLAERTGRFTQITSTRVGDAAEGPIELRVQTRENIAQWRTMDGALGIGATSRLTSIFHPMDPSQRRTQVVLAEINSILPNGAASASPLAVGDIIYSINNQFFTNIDDFFAYVRTWSPGDVVRLDYVKLQDGRYYTTYLRLGRRGVGGGGAYQSPPAQQGADAQASRPTNELSAGQKVGIAVLAGIALWVLGNAMSGSSSSSPATPSPSANDREEEQRRRLRDEMIYRMEEDQRRQREEREARERQDADRSRAW